MKSALLFPGLDALYVASKLSRWLAIPEVAAIMNETNRALARLTGTEENLGRLVTTSSRPHLEDFDRTTVALAAVQIGIARALETRETWDVVIGCSHGDIARSVICCVLSLDDAVEIIWTFADERKRCAPGKTANVRTVDGTPLTENQIDWLSREGGSPSVWSSHHATVAAELAVIERLAAASRERNLKVKPVFPFAVHSPVMKPLALRLAEHAGRWPISRSRWPVFSSVHARFLRDSEDFRAEALAGLSSPIPWIESLRSLRTEHGVERFLNVGPSNALTGWSLSDNTIDAWDLLQAQPC